MSWVLNDTLLGAPTTALHSLTMINALAQVFASLNTKTVPNLDGNFNNKKVSYDNKKFFKYILKFLCTNIFQQLIMNNG